MEGSLTLCTSVLSSCQACSMHRHRAPVPPLWLQVLSGSEDLYAEPQLVHADRAELQCRESLRGVQSRRYGRIWSAHP